MLIVGAGSYIGDNFALFAKNHLYIETVDSYKQWENINFEQYDTILIVAGIAHQKRKIDKDIYFNVNCELAVAIAKKAKDSSVSQLIYISSMAVYGDVKGEISSKKKPKPAAHDYYGLSKLKAEEALEKIIKTGLCIVRPPMVYGPYCPGNFSRLVSLAKVAPVFPDIDNRRSMIYISNLCSFLLFTIENNLTGIQQPQNNEYVNTTALVKIIAKQYNKRIRTTKLFNPIISIMARFIPSVSKLFHSSYYSQSLSESAYKQTSFEESIHLSVMPSAPQQHDPF